ncbi:MULTISPECIES: asparagine synthase (glutamine-hydrolyzing) [unclassified Ruegeria]|uniref:asparagine synthase (glutamine-hydrolyzing) n=1 Tax=unclassified Ruegeria TaxID=2625375 RepID=UPI0014927CDA|nr:MULTISPECIES: asparagine synthase (glutamine-hydrolyzing) [unclassified Ruegeria]NOD49757.1 asparagine synthase (glutamine-hydrolyzing) [Ruegeria sp. HKCCD5849]NOD54141.1 asparagine synthase (glutamine-hydrolyzing) [Ruegeria sp. HKCCD5851]NOD70088.1 asparagine synthase (glutamine-hydrolyzing) [Ruegeria sp. HKCCD7303]
MCGICGILRIDPATERPGEGLITAMAATLVHRGPNDDGIWLDEDVALGFRRLSVIDLSYAGHQPMTNEDGSVVIVFNGEIYNFQELKEKYRLEERGHVFKSRTDTEVLIHLYEEIGLDMIPELNGMYAFAIWDTRSKSLHLARDRYGIKPFFYQEDGDHFRFGSEIKAIIADDRVARKPSMQALHDFLTFNYIPGTQTAFEGISEVPPGHYMTVTAEGVITTQRYWDLHFSVDASITEEQAISRSYELMDKALQRRLVADVPIGVFLSGGLDSSTLVALMHKHVDEPIHTYSVGFEAQSFNELPFARIVAEAFNTKHREVTVTADMVRDMLPKYLSFTDEPYGDGSAIPTYFISELAKDEVVVVLSGEGGDEAFAGYDTHAAYNIYKQARKIPAFIRNGVMKPLVNCLPVSDKKLSFEFKAKRFLGGLDLPPEEAHLWWRTVLGEAEKFDLYADGMAEPGSLQPSVRHFQVAYEHCGADETLSRLMYIDSTVFLPDDLMIKNDRMTMAHSLEARVPFTDPELTGFLATVPSDLKMKNRRKKHLMRRAMENALPDSILNKKKVGLEMPYSSWLKAELKDLMMRYLGPENIRRTGLFRVQAVQTLIDDHVTGKRDNGRPLWGLLNYMMWYELYIDA